MRHTHNPWVYPWIYMQMEKPRQMNYHKSPGRETCAQYLVNFRELIKNARKHL